MVGVIEIDVTPRGKTDPTVVDRIIPAVFLASVGEPVVVESSNDGHSVAHQHVADDDDLDVLYPEIRRYISELYSQSLHQLGLQKLFIMLVCYPRYRWKPACTRYVSD